MTLKTWRILSKIRCSVTKIELIARAIHTYTSHIDHHQTVKVHTIATIGQR